MDKYERLKELIAKYARAAVAFSGGADSALLSYVAHEVLGDNMLALTVDSPAIPRREIAAALSFCKRYCIPHELVPCDVFDVEQFVLNPKDRCYYCKRAMFSAAFAYARERGFAILAEGTNRNDLTTYRPGLRAVSELAAVSPLVAAGFGKAEVRELSRILGLPTADLPSYSCLATRIPTGQYITPDLLERTEEAEEYLFSLGMEVVRVRMGERAVIETDEAGQRLALAHSDGISARFRELGYSGTLLDLTKRKR